MSYSAQIFKQKEQAAKKFSLAWENKGDEKSDTQRFWIGLLKSVCGIENGENFIEFEKRVKPKNTMFIDGYIPETKVLIEQKSINVDLTKEYSQSDGVMLTPYRQAKRYADELPNSMRPRWIVVSNFAEIHVHDMEFVFGETQGLGELDYVATWYKKLLF